MQAMNRHLTVTGFVIHAGRVALHWHRKIGTWLPAGGHIEAGEDPVEAVLREIKEEYALDAAIIETAPRVDYRGGPRQIAAPYTILNCEVAADHQHVDLVYFCRVLAGYPGRSYDPDNPIEWVDAATIASNEAISLGGCGVEMTLRPDVRALALEALRWAALPDPLAARPR
jgi:8-oxo-dGTP pyrophosphatase MutT (NUDIX family)